MLSLTHPNISKSIDGFGLRLEAPRWRNADAWIEARRCSRASLEPMEPEWPPDALTRSAYRRRIETDQANRQADLGFGFDVVSPSNGDVIGVVNLSNIRRNIQQVCTIGYWISDLYAGRGHMTNAVRLACGFAFETLCLHRIEAGHVPENTRSGAVLERCGFSRVGYAESYLKIAGTWRDHVLYALVNPNETV